eukprot:9025753-Prorocentrum_lima.AAC.1
MEGRVVPVPLRALLTLRGHVTGLTILERRNNYLGGILVGRSGSEEGRGGGDAGKVWFSSMRYAS